LAIPPKDNKYPTLPNSPFNHSDPNKNVPQSTQNHANYNDDRRYTDYNRGHPRNNYQGNLSTSQQFRRAPYPSPNNTNYSSNYQNTSTSPHRAKFDDNQNYNSRPYNNSFQYNNRRNNSRSPSASKTPSYYERQYVPNEVRINTGANAINKCTNYIVPMPNITTKGLTFEITPQGVEGWYMHGRPIEQGTLSNDSRAQSTQPPSPARTAGDFRRSNSQNIRAN
jgi:hypothetical protein